MQKPDLMASPKGPAPLVMTAIVPIKPLDAAKSRLEQLAPDARAALAARMATLTLDALAESVCIERVLVVSEGLEIAGLAAARGFQLVPDLGEGLNGAYATGLAAARAGGAGHVLLLHADFLTVDSGAIDELVSRYARQGRETAAALVPCKEGSGTNAVILPPGMAFTPMFGTDSLARHRAQLGQAALILESDALAQDIDQLSDLDGASTQILRRARALRDASFGDIVTYSPKLFLPLTQMCRDVCHYCTFAKTPGHLAQPFIPVAEAVEQARAGLAKGCKEALLTLGEKPELRYAAARQWLDAHGYGSTLDYVADVARALRDEAGILPHINAGCMNAGELAMLRPVCASMGLMLESTSPRLCEKGGPHYGSPDKDPAARLATLEEAGRQSIPFTTGLLIGIGETRAERIETLAAIRRLHERHGHIQEVIVQNFLPKPDTKMADHPPAPLEELVWTIAIARVMLGPEISIQAPPNLNAGQLEALVNAGINDWGGVSPLTPDFVNPEAPWPEIAELAQATARAGKVLAPRLTIYPSLLADSARWLDPAMRAPVLRLADGAGLAREDGWVSGRSQHVPNGFAMHFERTGKSRIQALAEEMLDYGADQFGTAEIASLFDARGRDYHILCEAADELSVAAKGDVATYVVNRNINYTNICTYRCTFCAFSKGTRKHEGAERPYLLDMEEIGRRVTEARTRGASEVCLQGGIHPGFTGETYLSILQAVKRAVPDMHVHAFSPLEIRHGADSMGMALDDYLALLRDHGLGSLPGTAAEILHDPVRATLCADKVSTGEWLEVIETAHRTGLRTTSTIMFGHVDSYRDWAIHLLQLRNLQMRTGGITEFVPLPFVAHEAPLYKRGQARRGPTLREALLMHAVGRLVLYPWIGNVQASWVKLGREGMELALRAGANDLGGTLMDESITRAAGATHGQEMTAADMQAMADSLGRRLVRRTTLYDAADTRSAPQGILHAF